MSHMYVCNSVAQYVTKLFIGEEKQLDEGRFNLYSHIAKKCLSDPFIYDQIKDNVSIEPTTIGTWSAIADYEHCFSPAEWKQILLFEHHFTLCYPNYEAMSPDEQDENRWKLYRLCLDMNTKSESFSNMFTSTISYNERRLHTAALNNDIYIFSALQHLALKLDRDIERSIKDAFNICNFTAITIDHTSSPHDNSKDVNSRT